MTKAIRKGAKTWNRYARFCRTVDPAWYTDLYKADLRGADLCGADLRGANLYKADLRWALPGIVCPEAGVFEAWKKCKDDIIIKLSIPADAKRSSATGSKCRASFVDVLEVIGADVGISQHDGKTEYRAGQRVTCDKWDDNRWNECSGGIHFFMTRKDTESY